MTLGTPTNGGGEQTPKPGNSEWEFEAIITTALEISPFDLEVLKRHLLFAKWIPSSTDEAAISDAVFRLRKLYKRGDDSYKHSFPENRRLLRLFDVWATEDIEECELEYADRGPKDEYNLAVRRESTKYNAVRDLFMHLAVSEASKRDKAAKAS
jgi:hypothetical protein